MPSILPKMPSFRSHEELVAAAAAASRRPSGPPDFVVKLFQMLQQEDTDLIAWDNGRIIMMNPAQLANEVLPKYFRHSRFSSFQRQLNNFGFRKIEGKGKLVPCMYARDDLEGQQPIALLSIRRKAATAAAKETFGGDIAGVRTSNAATEQLRKTDYRFRHPNDVIVGDESNPYKIEYPIKRRRVSDGSSRVTRSSEVEPRPERKVESSQKGATSHHCSVPSGGFKFDSYLSMTPSAACSSTEAGVPSSLTTGALQQYSGETTWHTDMDASVSSECELTGQLISDTLGDIPISTNELLDTLTLLDVGVLDQHDPLNLLPTLPDAEGGEPISMPTFDALAPSRPIHEGLSGVAGELKDKMMSERPSLLNVVPPQPVVVSNHAVAASGSMATSTDAPPGPTFSASIFGKQRPVSSTTKATYGGATDAPHSQASLHGQIPTLALPMHDSGGSGTPQIMALQGLPLQTPHTQPSKADLNPFQASLFGKKYRIALQG